MAETFPERVIYPVIPSYLSMGFFNAKDNKVDVIAMPAEGPSFPMSIYGKFK